MLESTPISFFSGIKDGMDKSTRPLPSLWTPACERLPEWDSPYLPNGLRSIHFSLIVHRASHSGNLFTGLQLLLTPRLVWLWNAQCRPEHISSRVRRIWIKLQQGQAERCLSPRAYCCYGSKWKKTGTFLCTDCHFDRLLKPALSRKPPSTLCKWGNVQEQHFTYQTSGGLTVVRYFKNIQCLRAECSAWKQQQHFFF